MHYLTYIIVLTLLQALIFGRIHLFGVATPLVYVYFVLLMPRNVSRIASMLMSFVLGLAVDIFGNTPGLATTSMTLVAFLQPYVLSLYLRNEDPEDYRPTLHNLGFVRYLSYALILLTVYCFVIFSLEAFTFVHWQQWLLSMVSSMLLTLILIIAVESVRFN
ncbi:MAG: rod shape-determining protein MreD [Prevotella sp.]|nr:rod shape-determining protein MreD [Prevotella sp.]MBR1839959.1 rod shape-determining protein MreD [Prevotella sp.]